MRGDGGVDAARHSQAARRRPPARRAPADVAGYAPSFSAAAGVSATVSVALPTAVLKLLKRHHRLTLGVAVESQGAAGQSATTSGKVLVKAYVKPKRPKRKKKKK